MLLRYLKSYICNSVAELRVPIFEKDDDGAEILFEHIKKWIAYDENGNEIIKSRKERIKHLADDLPKVAKAYSEFKSKRQ